MTRRRFEAFLLMNDREAKAWMSKLDPDDLASLEIMMDQARELQDAAPAKAKPPAPAAPAAAAPKPAPKPAPIPLGLGGDGIFRLTDEQARDPDFCFRTQKQRLKATSVEIVK